MLVSHKYFRCSTRLATLGFALCLSLAQISSAQGAEHFIAKAGSAGWVVFLDDGLTSFAGQVFTNGITGPEGQTFMVINFFRETPPTRLEVFGFGMIPNEAFEGNSSAHMSLHVDLSQATGFTSCFTDFSNGGTPICTDSPTGTISVDWKNPPFPFQSVDMVRRGKFDFGRMTMFLMAHEEGTTAITNVSAFGVDFPPGNGEMGVSRQMTVTIERKP